MRGQFKILPPTEKKNYHQLVIYDYPINSYNLPNSIILDALLDLSDIPILKNEKFVLSEFNAKLGLIDVPVLNFLPKKLYNFFKIYPDFIEAKLNEAEIAKEFLNIEFSYTLENQGNHINEQMDSIISAYSDFSLNNKHYVYDTNTFKKVIKLDIVNGPLLDTVINERFIFSHIIMGKVEPDVKEFLVERFKDWELILT